MTERKKRVRIWHNHTETSLVIIRLFIPAALILALAGSVPAQTPRTPDGHPDLQGIWNPATLTPLERPAEFAGKPTVTDEEARAYEKKDHHADNQEDSPPAVVAFNKAQKAVGAHDSDFWEKGTELARVNGVKRTSLIADPPDGKMPPRTPAGTQRITAFFESFNRYDGVKDRPLSERCISDNEVPIVPFGVDDLVQIVQTPGSVMILTEAVHDARIVRMNATHLAPNIRLWLGDSIGHWEGDTLVIDTTNFNGQLNSGGTSESLHVIERFSRVDQSTLLYKATVDDPATFAKPWTIEYPFAATPQGIFEYACHEGNYSLPSILAGARRSEGAPVAK